MVLEAQPPDFQRLKVVIVVSLYIDVAAHFAWHFDKAPGLDSTFYFKVSTILLRV